MINTSDHRKAVTHFFRVKLRTALNFGIFRSKEREVEYASRNLLSPKIVGEYRHNTTSYIKSV